MGFETGLVEGSDLRAFSGYIPDYISTDDEFVIGLTFAGDACGALVGHFGGEEIFDIDSLYVDPSVRRQGGGTLLLDTLEEELPELGDDVLARIAFAETDEESESLMEFLLSRGYATSAVDKAVYLIPEDEAGEAFDSLISDSSFAQTDDWEEKDLHKLIQKSGIGLKSDPTTPVVFDTELSAVITKDKKIESYIAALSRDSGLYALFAATMPDSGEGALEAAFAAFWNKISGSISPSDEILITAWKPEDKAAIERLFPESEDIYRSFFI